MSIDTLIQSTRHYSITKSIRRIYFINQKADRSSDEFKADYVTGSGTGIVMKIDEKFFVLTAKHVIGNLTKFVFENNSPFWFALNHQGFIDNRFEILYPGKIWFIGDLIEESLPLANIKDVILIEVFPTPIPPDHYIDIKDNFFSTNKNLKNLVKANGLGVCFGYPFKSNNFEWMDDFEAELTHSTNLTRNILLARLRNIEGEYVLNKFNEEIIHEEFTGMSGGLVTCLNLNSESTKAIGMLISGGNNIIRMIPFFIIHKYLLSHRRAESMLVDPLFEANPFENNPEKLEAYMLDLAEYFASKYERSIRE